VKPLRARLKEEANRKNIAQHVIEKDYALSYILAGIAKHSTLSDTLVFNSNRT